MRQSLNNPPDTAAEMCESVHMSVFLLFSEWVYSTIHIRIIFWIFMLKYPNVIKQQSNSAWNDIMVKNLISKWPLVDQRNMHSTFMLNIKYVLTVLHIDSWMLLRFFDAGILLYHVHKCWKSYMVKDTNRFNKAEDLNSIIINCSYYHQCWK